MVDKKIFEPQMKKRKEALLLKVVLFVCCTLVLCACSKDDDDDDGWDSSSDYNYGYISAPTGVSASVDGTTVYLSWNPVSGATSYNVYHCTTPNGYYSFRSTVETTYKTFTQESSGYHYYKVVAIGPSSSSDYSAYAYVNIEESNTGGGNNDGGNSNTGGDSGGNTGGGTTVQKPSAPTGVSVENEGPVDYPLVVVRWNTVSGATSYKVYRSSSANGSYSLIGQSDYNAYTDPNPPTNGSYAYYKVKSVNSAGESEYSSYAYYKSVTNGEAYSPAPVKYGNCTVSGTTMTLRWTIPTGTGIGTPTSAMLRVMNPNSGEYATLQTLSGTATSVSFTYTPWIDKNGIVRAGIVTENAKGSSGGLPVTYDTKNKTWKY